MKTQLSSLEINQLLKELNILIDGRIDKVFQVDKKEFYVQFHVPSKGKKILRITDKLMYLTSNKPEIETPPEFCMFLRRQLENSRLKEISQKEPERIIEFVFETKEGVKKLIVELFGGGNLLVLDKDNIILSAAHYEKYKERDVLAKSKYNYPKMPYNIFNLKSKDLESLFKKTDKESLVKCLAIELGLGGTYSEEVCLLSNINKSTIPKKINENEITIILKTIKKIINNKTNPVIIYKNKESIDVLPFSLDFYKDMETKEFGSFNESLDYYYTKELKAAKKECPYEKQINEIKRIIEEQKETIESMKEKEKDLREKGELFYKNYQLIHDIITEINKAKEKYSWEEIKEKLKGHKVVKDVDLKEKKVVIEI